MQGPFYWEGAPDLPLGADIGEGVPGEPALYSGRVTDTRRPAARGRAARRLVGRRRRHVRHAARRTSGMRARARFRTDAEGRYWFWSIRPTFYPVPDDGPVGDMLRAHGPRTRTARATST